MTAFSSRYARFLHVLVLVTAVSLPTSARSRKRPASSRSASSLRRDSKISEAHYLAAVDFFRKGNYREAARLFLEAYKESGRASLLYNVGVCYERMGLLRKALEYYDKFFTLYPDERHKVEEHLEHLRQRVRNTFLSFTGGAAGARVTVNGRPVCTLPCPKVRVTPNEKLHIRIERKGYLPYIATVTVLPGATQNVLISMPRSPMPRPVQPAATAPATDSSPDMWSVVFLSSAVVLGVASGTFGYMALGYADEYSDSHDDSDASMARSFAAASDAALAGALIFGGVALYRYLHGKTDHAPLPSGSSSSGGSSVWDNSP